jgi:hypothetical protein
MTTVTLIRFHADEADDDVRTYAAVRSSDAVDLLADGFELGDAETVPWDALPGIEELAASRISGQPPRSVAIIGTSEGAEWATWHVPAPAPPVPAA